MTTPKKYTRFFMQHDRVHTALSGDAAVVCMRGQAGVLAETRHEQETARSALLAADRGDSVVAVKPEAQPETVTYNAYGYRNPNDIPSHRPAFNGRLLLWYLYLLGNGYRAYNPVLMCFQSPDSQSPFGAGGLNCYAYCAGDPVNFTDPSGHSPRPRSVSLSGRMSESRMKRIVSGIIDKPAKRPRRSSEGGTMSSSRMDQMVQDALDTQPGWNTSRAPVQDNSQHNLGLSSGQPLPGASSAVNSVASSSGVTVVINSGDSWGAHRRTLSSSDVKFLEGYKERIKKPVPGLDMDSTIKMIDIAINALAEGGNMRASLMLENSNIMDDQVENIRRRLTGELKRVRGPRSAGQHNSLRINTHPLAQEK